MSAPIEQPKKEPLKEPQREQKIYEQVDAYASPWTVREKFRMVLWEFCWALCCVWTPKNLNFWRLFWLRRFGARLVGRPFVHQRARIQKPWNLTMYDKACLGDRANAYSLARIEIGERATIAQEAYLCTGTHDFSRTSLPLVTSGIVIGPDVFIGARAFIMPGVMIGPGAVIGAASLVTKDLPAWTICVGQPCRPIKPRVIADTPDSPDHDR